MPSHKKKNASRSSGSGPRAIGVQMAVEGVAEEAAVPVAIDENCLEVADNGDMLVDEEVGKWISGIYIPPPVHPQCSMESTGPRTIIKKIEIYNFKSFAGKVSVGPFHHCLTSLIAPNGSAKSHILDAMLFVFGYSATYRCSTHLWTLLHSSACYSGYASCSVAVHFLKVEDMPLGLCNEIPNSEIIVERTAFQDNTSYYTINGHRMEFERVLKLLKQHNIELDTNHFVIVQDELKSLAAMKSKGETENECGMLEYLENIIGTSRYKVTLGQINDRVEMLTKQQSIFQARYQLTKQEIFMFERTSNLEAVDVLRRNNELTRTSNMRIQKYLRTKKEKLQVFTKTYVNANNILKNHDAKLEILQDKLLKKIQSKEASSADIDNMSKNIEQLKSQLEKTSTSYRETKSTMSLMATHRENNLSKLKQSRLALYNLFNVHLKSLLEVSECLKKVIDIENDKKTLVDQLNTNYALIGSKTKLLIEERDVVNEQLNDLVKNLSKVKVSLSIAESKLRLIKSNERNETGEYHRLKSSLEEALNSRQENRERCEQLKVLISNTVSDLQCKTELLGKSKKDEQDMLLTLKQLQAGTDESRHNQMTTGANVAGLIRRLANLVSKDSKYDVPMSSYCEGLDKILESTRETAQQCTGHLNFNALEEYNKWVKQMAKPNTPENLPRLSDLMMYPTPALDDTLVAVNLDQAVRVAFGEPRQRVVTLSGCIIEPSGLMSGGGDLIHSANDGPTTTSQHELKLMQEQIHKLQNEQGELEQLIVVLQNNKGRYESELEIVGHNLKNLEDNVVRMSKHVDEQNIRMQETSNDGNKVAQVQLIVENKRTELNECQSQAQTVRTKKNTIQRKLDQIYYREIIGIQKKTKRLTNTIDIMNTKKLKLVFALSTSVRNVSKMKRTINDLKIDIDKAESQITLLTGVAKMLNDEQTKILKNIEEHKEKIQKVTHRKWIICNEIRYLEERKNKKQLTRLGKVKKVNINAGKIDKIKLEIEQLVVKLSKLQLNEIAGSREPEPPLKKYMPAELDALEEKEIQKRENLQFKMLNKKTNVRVVNEYAAKRKVLIEQEKALDDIKAKRNEMLQLYEEICKKRCNEFKENLNKINSKLKEVYGMFEQGGYAKFEIFGSMDPYVEGVRLTVRPPQMSTDNPSLSVGQKTVASLAILFALNCYKPSPIYLMDEIDASVDVNHETNIGLYIKEFSKNAQFIVVSPNSKIIELSQHVVGIYKMKDSSECQELNNETPENLLASSANN